MDALDPTPISSFDDHRGQRQHRFMESSDINAALRALFALLQAELAQDGNAQGLYGVEMDACIPGEVLATTVIPMKGVGDPCNEWIRQLFTAYRPEALFAWVSRRRSGRRTQLVVELYSEDACCIAECALRKLRNGYELVDAPQRPAASN